MSECATEDSCAGASAFLLTARLPDWESLRSRIHPNDRNVTSELYCILFNIRPSARTLRTVDYPNMEGPVRYATPFAAEWPLKWPADMYVLIYMYVCNGMYVYIYIYIYIIHRYFTVIYMCVRSTVCRYSTRYTTCV